MSRTGKNRAFDGTNEIPVGEMAIDPEYMITERRLERLRSTIERRQPDLHLVLENVHDPHNVSAVLRTCDAVGVGSVHLVYTYEKFPSRLGRTSSASAWKWMDLLPHGSIEECYAHLRSLGCRIYATDLSSRAESLFTIDMRGPVALVFGNEKRGVSREASDLADGNLLIPMVGLIQSLNISVACAVTLYEAMRQRTEAGMYDRPSLPEAELEAKLREWVER
jgi:tRNA (guanosine-2'-O-)-methyltransferase